MSGGHNRRPGDRYGGYHVDARHGASGLRLEERDAWQGAGGARPTVVDATWQGDRFKFGRLARLMGGYTAEDCAGKIRGFERKIGLDVTLGDLGSANRHPWLTQNAMKVSPANIANTRPKSARSIAELYRKAL